ncbi:MAG: DsrE family protein [Sulfuricella sp.]|nr:DsrE family protein [Sulfuricella sp.]
MNYSWLKRVVLSFAVMLFGLSAYAAGPGGDVEKVVYHVNDSKVARAALNNIRNHLEATAGKAKIVVVTHGDGVNFLLEDAQDKNGNPYNIAVEELADRGVEFRVCNNTLKANKIDPKTVLPSATIVPSGVAEIGRLQAREGFVYLKP